jgi:aldehyde dehydrogenase (NAD+)
VKLDGVQRDIRNYINGRWETGATIGISENPSDPREVVAEYARADRHQTQQAVRAAADAFAPWSRTAPQRRADALDQIGSELLARKEELGLLLAREEGKTLPEAVAEVVHAGHIFKFFAGEAVRSGGSVFPAVRPGVQVDVHREPVGVVALMASWCFPFAVPASKIAPALAYGNSVVFKPAELVPACGWALAEIISRAGLPAGVFNLVMGGDREVGQTLVDSPALDGISFSGSEAEAERILRATGERHTKLQLETSGQNPLVVLADADLEHAVDCAVRSAYFATGQRGSASNRLIGIDIGPVVDRKQLKRDLDSVLSAKTEGAEHVFGGERLERPTPGHFMNPALFLAQPEHRIAREHIFGPVACVLRAEDADHALALANDPPYGLCMAVCTRSLQQAANFRRHARADVVMVNMPTADADMQMLCGTRRASHRALRGHGQARHSAADFYTTVKTAYTMTH